MKINLIKKIAFYAGTLFLGIGLGFLVWLTLMGGGNTIKEKNSLPEKPQGNYTGFYYKNLSDKEKIAYEIIKAEIEAMPKKIRIPDVEAKNITNIFEALFYDNPEYFFLSENCSFETTGFGKCYFVPEYSMDMFTYNEQLSELHKVRDIILEKAGNVDGDYEKELLIHDYIVGRCEYVEKTGGTYSSAYGCLVRGFASCEGYAKAMKYLLDEIGIEGYIATGTVDGESSNTEGHAWNIVKIENNYYHVDATWDDPLNSEIKNQYAYFNLNDKEIAKTHSADERYLGKCTETKENYYAKNGILFSSYDGNARNAITSELAKQIRLDNDILSFKFKSSGALKDAKEALFDMNGIYSIFLSANIMSDEIISQETVSYAVDDTHNIIIIAF